MSTKVVPAPASQVKKPARSDKPANQVDQKVSAVEDEARLAQDDSEDEVSVVGAEEGQQVASDTSMSAEFSFGGALAEAASSASLLTSSADAKQVSYGQSDEGGAGGTILLVGALALVALGVYVLADGGSSNKNEAPTVSVASQALAVVEDTAKAFTVTASDPDGDVLTYTASGATKGTVTGGTGGAFTYTPNANATGTDTITVTIKDPKGLSVTHTVNVTISGVPDAPVAGSPQAITTEEDTAKTGTVSITDADGDAITYAVSVAASHGIVTLGQNGAYTYTPHADFNGTDTFSVTGTTVDGSATQVVNVTVTPVNDVPVQGAETTTELTVSKDGSAQFFIDFDDVDGDTLTASSTTPAHGTIDPTTNTYTPNPGFIGTDTFNVTVSDGKGGNVTYAVEVTVVDGPLVTEVLLDNLVGTLNVNASDGAYVFNDDKAVRTDAVITGFGPDDSIAVDGLANANSYFYTTANVLGTDVDDLIISFSDATTGQFTNIVLVDAAINADGGNNFVFNYATAVASLGFDFITIV